MITISYVLVTKIITCFLVITFWDRIVKYRIGWVNALLFFALIIILPIMGGMSAIENREMELQKKFEERATVLEIPSNTNKHTLIETLQKANFFSDKDTTEAIVLKIINK